LVCKLDVVDIPLPPEPKEATAVLNVRTDRYDSNGEPLPPGVDALDVAAKAKVRLESINIIVIMQQVQKVNDYCTQRENCRKSDNTFCTCCIQHFFYDRAKKRDKNNDEQQFSPVRRM
jgi:hypothetical protein